MIVASLQGIPAFLAYFMIGYVLVLLFTLLYTWITPHHEWTLLKQNNRSAAIAFGMSIVGFTIPLASAAINAVGLLDYVLWGLVALIAQLVTFFTVRLYIPKLSERVSNDELATGVFLGCAALATGILNAACMTY